jgi:aryl-alcohol dehydrogenase-like predicted oxidoreductase
MSLGEDEKVNRRIVDRALAGGINFFDTADLYEEGRNEEKVGRLLKQRRNELVLATKVGNRWREDGSGWDWDPRKEYIMSAVESSLRRLGTDRIDLYQLHGGTLEDPIDETLEAFELLQRQGKIRYYGISSIRPNVIRAWIRKSTITSVMMQYSLLDRRPEESVMEELRLHGIGILARGALGKGLLVDKKETTYLEHGAEDVKNARGIIFSHSGNDRKPAHTALQFVLANPAVTVAVAGIRTEEQLEDAIGAIRCTQLSARDLEELRGGVPVYCYREHR